MGELLIIGLGAGELDQLPLGVYKQLISNKYPLFLRTKEHPIVSELESEGMNYISFDSVYETHNDFESVYQEITDILLEKAANETIIYAVPGHPMVAERTVQLLIDGAPSRGVTVKIGGGQSFLDSLFASVGVDPVEGFQLLDGTSLSKDEVMIHQHIIISQVYDAFVASEVKLTLMEKYRDDHEVVIVTAAGSSEEKITRVPLYELDHGMELNNLTSLYIPPVKDKAETYREFSTLRSIIAELRGPNGCPWDKEQTHQSLKKYLIEESYELLAAIDNDDIDEIIEELGDVLLQVILHAQIGEDEGMFTIEDVIESISEKMIRRHPHVFSDTIVEDTSDVLKNWEMIKQEERSVQPVEQSRLDKVEKGLPAILRAYAYQKEASKVGFDWDKVAPALEKVEEEIQELKVELTNEYTGNRLIELGDVFFALINVARLAKLHPEEALQATNEKFLRRFRHVEKRVLESGRDFSSFTLDELDVFWEEAKNKGVTDQ